MLDLTRYIIGDRMEKISDTARLTNEIWHTFNIPATDT
jgi:hypothetical protein